MAASARDGRSRLPAVHRRDASGGAPSGNCRTGAESTRRVGRLAVTTPRTRAASALGPRRVSGFRRTGGSSARIRSPVAARTSSMASEGSASPVYETRSATRRALRSVGGGPPPFQAGGSAPCAPLLLLSIHTAATIERQSRGGPGFRHFVGLGFLRRGWSDLDTGLDGMRWYSPGFVGVVLTSGRHYRTGKISRAASAPPRSDIRCR